jgi:hypothetical protein
MSWKNKEYVDLKDFLISCGIYFVIVEDNLCISILYYLLQSLYMVLIVKKIEIIYELINKIVHWCYLELFGIFWIYTQNFHIQCTILTRAPALP